MINKNISLLYFPAAYYNQARIQKNIPGREVMPPNPFAVYEHGNYHSINQVTIPGSRKLNSLTLTLFRKYKSAVGTRQQQIEIYHIPTYYIVYELNILIVPHSPILYQNNTLI